MKHRHASKFSAIAADQRFAFSAILAGTAGGLAEILWIWGYSAGTNTDALRVARGIAEVAGMDGSFAAPLGIAIHMALAALLGIGIVAGLAILPVRFSSRPIRLMAVIGALAAVWAFNFLLLLPAISPAFVAAVPLSISFVSKFLFGLSAFVVFELTGNRLGVAYSREDGRSSFVGQPDTVTEDHSISEPRPR
jgi:hypothetical protein